MSALACLQGGGGLKNEKVVTKKPPNEPSAPCLSPKCIDRAALEIIQKLQHQGYEAYVVGGCVRDLLLGGRPKDFDIVTNASPQQIKRAIPRAYIIGKRFRLVLAQRGPKQFEVSTFRRKARADEAKKFVKGHLSENTYGTQKEDATRRDFSVNALFYDPFANRLVDYTEGEKDMRLGVVRSIGPVHERLAEDSVRMLRAIRLAHMVRFALEPQLRLGIFSSQQLLQKALRPRVREEILKFLRLSDPAQPFLSSFDLGLMPFLCAPLLPILQEPTSQKVFTQTLHDFKWHFFTQPHDLFGAFLMAFLAARAALKGGEAFFASKAEAQNSLWLKELMQQHLNMSNFEQRHFVGYFDFRRSLVSGATPAEHEALAKSPHLGFWLLLAEKEHLVAPEQLLKWHLC